MVHSAGPCHALTQIATTRRPPLHRSPRKHEQAECAAACQSNQRPEEETRQHFCCKQTRCAGIETCRGGSRHVNKGSCRSQVPRTPPDFGHAPRSKVRAPPSALNWSAVLRENQLNVFTAIDFNQPNVMRTARAHENVQPNVPLDTK